MRAVPVFRAAICRDAILRNTVLCNRTAGFTLIELIMVVLLLGIVATFSSRFISSNVLNYQTRVDQNTRLNDARFIFNRLDKELNSAVTFSVKMDTAIAGRSCVEFVPFTAVGQYIGSVRGQSAMSLIMDPVSREKSNNKVDTGRFIGQYVSVFTTKAADFTVLPSATLAKIASYTPASGANPTLANVEFTTGDKLTRDSLSSRYFIVKHKVRYCLLQYLDSMRLFRNQALLSENYTTDNRVLMAENLSVGSRIRFSPSNEFSQAILDLNLGFKLRDGSVIRFEHQLVMNNVP